jgi:hypothetical protein
VCRQNGRSTARRYGPYQDRGYDPSVYGGHDSYGDPYSDSPDTLKDDGPYLLGTILLGQLR